MLVGDFKEGGCSLSASGLALKLSVSLGELEDPASFAPMRQGKHGNVLQGQLSNQTRKECHLKSSGAQDHGAHEIRLV